MDPLTSKLARRISEERAGKQAGFLQDLKPIADTQHQPAPIRKVGNCLHHRREPRNRAAAQVVTVGKPARQDDQFQIVESTLAMVDVAHRLAEDLPDCMETDPVTPGARKDDDSRPQAGCTSMRKSSITALARSCCAIASTRARARSSSGSSRVIARYLPARTSFTDSNPRACRPPRIVRPAGSLTTGFSVTKTSALNTRAHLQTLDGQAPERLEVAGTRSLDDLIRQRGRRRGVFPAHLLEVIADELLIE